LLFIYLYIYILILIIYLFEIFTFLVTNLGHVVCMGERRGIYRWGNLRERDRLGDPGMDGRIILRWIFRKWDVGVWTGLSGFRIGTGHGHW
jgi:hypothetical protein